MQNQLIIGIVFGICVKRDSFDFFFLCKLLQDRVIAQPSVCKCTCLSNPDTNFCLKKKRNYSRTVWERSRSVFVVYLACYFHCYCAPAMQFQINCIAIWWATVTRYLHFFYCSWWRKFQDIAHTDAIIIRQSVI